MTTAARPTRASGRWAPRLAAVLATAAALCGCPERGASGALPQIAPPEAVRAACSRCHALPPPDALPQARWEALIPQMPAMPGPSGVTPLSGEECAAALDYYRAAAPRALPPPTTRPLSPRREEFVVEDYTPPALERRAIPAVSFLAFTPFLDDGRQDLLVCELRSQALYHLARWAPARHRRLRLLARDLGYPAHVALHDLDGDDRRDALLAGLGTLEPSNATQGSVRVLRGAPDHDLLPAFALEDLGRACDLRPLDADGDGDLDLVACVFGWRGPGNLLLLRRGAGDLAFRPEVLDERDGFIHVEPLDLDADGDTDLVALLAQEHEQVVAFRNEGGAFTAETVFAAPHPSWGSSGLEAVDLDRDGDPDLLVSNGDAVDDLLLKPYHGVGWLENDGAGGFTYRRIADLVGCERAVAGDLDGDGDLDVVAVAFLPHHPPETWRARDLDSVLWLERTDAGWNAHALEKHRPIHAAVAVGDADGDGDLDIAVGNYVWTGPGGETASPAPAVTLFLAR